VGEAERAGVLSSIHPHESYTNNNTGNPQHHLDIRVYCPEPEGQDRQLHQRLLKLLLYNALPLILVSPHPAFIPIC
jgi:hypothetical protein